MAFDFCYPFGMDSDRQDYLCNAGIGRFQRIMLLRGCEESRKYEGG